MWQPGPCRTQVRCDFSASASPWPPRTQPLLLSTAPSHTGWGKGPWSSSSDSWGTLPKSWGAAPRPGQTQGAGGRLGQCCPRPGAGPHCPAPCPGESCAHRGASLSLGPVGFCNFSCTWEKWGARASGGAVSLETQRPQATSTWWVQQEILGKAWLH